MRPHLVVLGAGASRAATPHGDANHEYLPLMNDFVEVLSLQDTLDSAGVGWSGRNFEDIYSQLVASPALATVKSAVEAKVFDYFSSLEIPDNPTPYDYLVLSLRPSDVIATFNWDPFLIQALCRCGRLLREKGVILKPPKLLFLHGNVSAGRCPTDGVFGMVGQRCSRCGNLFTPSSLLYPINNKNYVSDPFIAPQWKQLDGALAGALMLTVFGYSAPTSDVNAVSRMKTAWGDVDSRSLEQTEIIDIKSEDEILRTWEPFYHSHHVDVWASIKQSWIFRHPRRTCEAMIEQYFECKFLSDEPISVCSSLDELVESFVPLIEAEDAIQVSI